MVYLFKVYALVATIVFGCSAVVMLGMLGWQQARDYSRAHHIMQRIVAGRFREPIAISRSRSRFHEEDSLHTM